MTVVHALSLLALALGQAEPPPPPARPPAAVAEPAPPVQPLPLAEPRLVAAPGKQAAAALVKPGAPALVPGRTSRCFERAIGGRWRAQCDANGKRCLVAPDAELSAEGLAVAGLERVPACVTPGWREDDLAGQGYAIVPALAEAPAGWIRDERQRVMQVSFDLNRRFWLGAGWGAGGLPGSGAGEATAGIRWDYPFRLLGAPALARMRFLETYAAFDGDYAEATAFAVDASRAYPSPLIRITTFVGKPRRFDPPLYVGLWAEVARLETFRTETGWFDRTGVASAAVTLDLWRSRDLASFVRLRAGAGYESAEQLDGAAWVPHGAVDLQLGIDRDGFHGVRFTALAERLLTTGTGDYQPKDAAVPRLPDGRTRLTAKAEYEVILLAVNDQPVTAVLDARVQKRNDVPGLPTGWEAQGTASLRFSFWAPAPRGAVAQEKL